MLDCVSAAECVLVVEGGDRHVSFDYSFAGISCKQGIFSTDPSIFKVLDFLFHSDLLVAVFDDHLDLQEEALSLLGEGTVAKN